MNNNYDWQVYIEYRPSMMARFIYIFRKVDLNKSEFLIKGGDSSQIVDVNEKIEDELYFAKLEDDYMGSLIIDALDKKGIKAPSQSFTEGKLQATEAHLNDLRQLIPKLQNSNKVRSNNEL